MSLSALRRDYQKSLDKVWEDLSNPQPHPTEPRSAKFASRQQAMAKKNNRETGFLQKHHQGKSMPEATTNSEFIQFDAKAWGNYLSNKRSG